MPALMEMGDAKGASGDCPLLAGVSGVESFLAVSWGGLKIEGRHNKQLRLQQKITAVRKQAA